MSFLRLFKTNNTSILVVQELILKAQRELSKFMDFQKKYQQPYQQNGKMIVEAKAHCLFIKGR